MNGTVVRARRARSAHFFFSFSGAQRKDFRRGRSKSLHAKAAILLLVSPGGKVSFGNKWNTLQCERTRLLRRTVGEKGTKVDAHFRRWSSELLLLSPRKGVIKSRETVFAVCAGCRRFQLPVSPNKVSSVLSLLLSKWLRIVGRFWASQMFSPVVNGDSCRARVGFKIPLRFAFVCRARPPKRGILNGVFGTLQLTRQE